VIETVSNVASVEAWPRLNLAEWSATYETLHRWTQIVGKTRLKHAPMLNHFWHVTLYLSARGLTTSPIPDGDRSFEIEFDFIDHQLVVRVSDGETRSIPLAPQSVADFYNRYIEMLRSVGIEARIWPVPSELADTLRFTDDSVHHSYDADSAHRCWQALVQVNRLLGEFRGRFLGKSSPVHFWWGAFDIACTRFSGRRAPVHPGGVPNLPDWVTRESYSHECISAGWWPGTVGGPVTEAAFYAYSYPEPPGCAQAPIAPAGAYWDANMHEWFLPYELVRSSANPDETVMTFLQSTYSAAADLGGWDRQSLERTV
jgi:hypothetical protein